MSKPTAGYITVRYIEVVVKLCVFNFCHEPYLLCIVLLRSLPLVWTRPATMAEYPSSWQLLVRELALT